MTLQKEKTERKEEMSMSFIRDCDIYLYIYICQIHSLFSLVIITYDTLHEKNDFADIFKNLARQRSENNFVGSIIM